MRYTKCSEIYVSTFSIIYIEKTNFNPTKQDLKQSFMNSYAFFKVITNVIGKESPYYHYVRRIIILKLDCEYVITPRILFNDKKLSRTDNDVLSTIISLALKKDYCYASNEYLAKYVNSSKRTITKSLSKLKELNYIFIKYVDNRRRIYLNLVKLKTIVSSEVAGNGYEEVEESFYHKRNNIKKIYNKGFIKQGIIPYWMEHPEAIKDDPATEEEIAEMNELLKEFKN